MLYVMCDHSFCCRRKYNKQNNIILKNKMNLKLFRDNSYIGISITVVVSMAMFPSVSAADDCYYKPCQKYGNQSKSCQFSIACKLERPFAKCQVSGLYLDRPAIEQSSCIDPRLVPGFKDFCRDLLYNKSLAFPGPANTNNDDVTNIPGEDVVHESKLHVDNTCFDTTILASVAIGCFLAGGFVMWVLQACCRTSVCICSEKKDQAVTDAGNEHANWYPQARGREIGSTSSAQLLTNASMDSMGTHNTLLSNCESHVSNEGTASGLSAHPHLRDHFGTWTGSGRSPLGPPQFPSPNWSNNLRSRSAQWTDPRSMSLSQTHAPVSHWNTEHMSLPRSQSETARWIPQGQPRVATDQSLSAPWLDTIYSPESESSSRDYQSIHGGSENPYAPCSESSSDYSAPQTHRVMLMHDGEIYQPSSESGGSNNDYTSLKGQRFSRTNDFIYYPTSEGSNKDYASLVGEKDNLMNTCSGFNSDTTNSNINTNGEDSGNNVKFNVKGLNFPYQTSCKSNRGWVSNLQEINEYESVDTATKGADKAVDVSNVRTLADMTDVNHNSETSVQPHEYYTLEPLQKKDS